jgi:hypothetical protein
LSGSAGEGSWVVQANPVIPIREMERMMKLQDVILKAMAKKLTWIEAAEIAGMSVRNMQRKRQAYIDYGYTGLADGRFGKLSYHRIPMATAEKVLALYQERYFDLNVRHFQRKTARRASDRNQLQLGKEGAAGCGAGAEKQTPQPAPQAPGAAAVAGDAAAH